MIETPNYERYTTEELVEVAAHIDRARYPERWALIEAELKRRTALGESITAAHRDNLIFDIAMLGSLGAVFLPLLNYIFVTFIVPTSAAQPLETLGDIIEIFLPAFALLGWLLGAGARVFVVLKRPNETHWLHRLPRCLGAASIALLLTPFFVGLLCFALWHLTMLLAAAGVFN